MEASLFGSIFFVAALAILFMGVFQYKKSDTILNGVSWALISLVSILCYGSMTAGIINVIKVPINLYSMGTVYFITGILLLLRIKKENEKQKYSWEIYDFIYVAIFTACIAVLVYKYFGPELELMYLNSDAAVHYKNAMLVVRNERIEDVYFASLHCAMSVEVCMPFMAELNLYKVYILFDAGMLLLEILFFGVVIRDFVKTRAVKVIAVCIAAVYMLGYPLNSFLFSFFYWGMGVMVIAFLLLMLRYFANQVIERRLSVLGMMLACAALPVTYMLFGPIMYFAALITLIVIRAREGRVFSWQNVALALKVFLLPTCITIYYCFLDFLIKANQTVGGILQIEGGIYRELYANFIWVLPFVIYALIKTIREKKISETMVSLLFVGAIVVIMCCLIYEGHMRPYYFYKLYYPLWLFCFIITIEVLEDVWEKHRDMIISMGVVFAFIVGMFVSHAEEHMINRGTWLVESSKANTLLDIWSYNIMLYASRNHKLPDQYAEICNYVIEDLAEEEKLVPLLACQENYVSCFWYEGLTGEISTNYYGWDYSFEEVKVKLESGDVNYFVVYKDSPIYANNVEYFEQFEFVLENELGFVAKIN